MSKKITTEPSPRANELRDIIAEIIGRDENKNAPAKDLATIIVGEMLHGQWVRDDRERAMAANIGPSLVMTYHLDMFADESTGSIHWTTTSPSELLAMLAKTVSWAIKEAEDEFHVAGPELLAILVAAITHHRAEDERNGGEDD